MKGFYHGSCPICSGPVISYKDTKDKEVGYIYQGKIRRYFHLACLDSIKRGNNRG